MEKTDTAEHIVIVGCGRVGVELALSISHQGHNVTIVDPKEQAFDRLGPDFRGRTVRGEAFDPEVLKRAGLDSAHGFAAVTSSDSVNIVTARVARDHFHVPHVVARVYNPRRTPIYEKLGLQTVASSSWGAQRIEQLLLHPGIQSVCSAGNGEVQVYELIVAGGWNGRRLADLVPAGEAIAFAVTRGGKATLPTADIVLQTQDVLHVGATTQGMTRLRRSLDANGEA